MDQYQFGQGPVQRHPWQRLWPKCGPHQRQRAQSQQRAPGKNCCIGPSLAKNELEQIGNWVLHKNSFFHNSGWNWGGLEVSRVTARTVRRQRNIFLRDLVLHGIEKSIFQHFPVNWHFKVLEMALKTFHFVPGLSRTPLLFIPRYITNILSKNISPGNKLSRIGNLKISKSKNPGSLTGAQIFGWMIWDSTMAGLAAYWLR